MGSTTKIKSFFMIVLVGIALYGLFPSFSYYSMTAEERQEKEAQTDPEYQQLKTKILNLGLDLQGGIHLVVEVDVKKFLTRLAKRSDDVLERATSAAAANDLDPIGSLEASLVEQGATLVGYYGSRRNKKLDEEIEVKAKLTEDLTNSVDRALEIIRNRIDQFGVAEPVIQKLGERRIVIEVAGDVEPSRIRKTIFTEARLEFRLVAEEEDAESLFNAVNGFYQKKFDIDVDAETASADSAKTDGAADANTEAEEDVADASKLFGGNEDTDAAADSSAVASVDEPSYDTNLLVPIYQNQFQTVAILAKNKPILDSLLADRDLAKHVRKEVGNFRVVYKKTAVPSGATREFYLVEFVKGRLEMSGEGVVDSKWSLDPEGVNTYVVTMKFDDKSSRKFSNLSDRYTGKQLAIILDDVVQSDPVFREKIPIGSSATISGSMDQAEAKDLSIVLKTGSLPAPLKLIEEETVSASLGAASVAAGTTSTIAGIFLVLVFMMIYYKKAGGIASVAVIINMMLIMSALAAFGGTLTLPGIAGIILTIGMSVDANVLIFERIREEIAGGARVFSALENGYSRATVAILDANITTFIAGVVLYSYGSGTIRGFALTLMIGILTSLITAVIMTRVIFETTTKKTDQTISV